MQVKRIGFVGVRARDVRAATAFFRDVLGLPDRRDDDRWSILQLPSGGFDFLEVYAEDFSDERVAPDGASLFVAFIVDEIRAAREEIIAAGAEASEIVWAEEAFGNKEYRDFAWFFFRAPDGHAYVIEQVPEGA